MLTLNVVRILRPFYAHPLRYEHLQMEHRKLSDQIQHVTDGSGPHLARLQAELAALQEAGRAQQTVVHTQSQQLELAQSELNLREKQLAVLVSHFEVAEAEHGVGVSQMRHGGMATTRETRSLLELRENQLVSLIKQLYLLASKEKISGAVSHDSRSRLYSQCAAIFESVGADAYSLKEEHT